MLYLQLILLFLACSLWIVGFHNATLYELKGDFWISPQGTKVDEPVFEYREILWWLRYYGDKIIGEYWSKPIYGCPMCMASVHGGAWFIFFNHEMGLTVKSVALFFLFITALSGFMKLIVKKFDI